MNLRLIRCLLLLLFCGAGISVKTQAESVGHRAPIPVDGKKSVPLRIIARPTAKIYKERNDKQVVRSAKPFEVFYVYSRPGASQAIETAWYEVGTDTVGTTVGFMKAEFVIEWKQALCMDFEHPDDRKPVLMFADRKGIEALATCPASQRTAGVQRLYEQIEHIAENGLVPNDFPVVSMEPKRDVEISNGFYLMPILDYKEVSFEDWEARLLQIAAVANAAADGRATTIKNKDYLSSAVQETSGDLSAMKVDIVYCADLTGSMKPYVQTVLEIARQVAVALGQTPGVQERLRFGFWGYRDNESIKGIEFDTRNFTPQLQPLSQFVNTLATIKTVDPTADDYPEDMFTGMYKAITETAWTPQSLKIIILMGDAPSHEAGHKWNQCKMGAEQLRDLANQKDKINIYAIHIKDPQYPQYHALAESQFMALAKNEGTTKNGIGSYVGVNPKEGFQHAAEFIYNEIQRLIVNPNSIISADEAAKKSGDPIETAVRDMIHAAVVRWLGRQQQVQPPNGITAWVCDKDLLRPEMQSMKVNILLTKNQLDSLETMLKTVIEAGNAGMLTGRDFFTALQSVAATATVQPDQIKRAKNFAETGLVPEFLQGLPYKSNVMALSDEIWASWSATEQEKFLKNIAAMREFYRSLHDRPDMWMRLSDNTDEGDKVVQIELTSLP